MLGNSCNTWKIVPTLPGNLCLAVIKKIGGAGKARSAYTVLPLD
jgi:hypothetical protein